MGNQRVRKGSGSSCVQLPRRSWQKSLTAALRWLLPLLVMACAGGPPVIKTDDPLFGTWVNAEYEVLGRTGGAKAVIYADGRELEYVYIADTEPVLEIEFRIERAWIDAQGNHWYRIHHISRPLPARTPEWEGFALNKVSAGGGVLEGVWNRFDYPTEIAPADPSYGILYKQK